MGCYYLDIRHDLDYSSFMLLRSPPVSPERVFHYDLTTRAIRPATQAMLRLALADVAREEHEYLEYEVKKPAWFEQAELDAAHFLRPFGIASHPSHIIQNPVFFEDEVAFVPHFSRRIFLNDETIETYYILFGVDGVAAVLVHENVHAAAKLSPVIGLMAEVADEDMPTYGLRSRMGYKMTHVRLSQKEAEETRGSFFEEALANFFDGYYIRVRRGETGLISFKGTPRDLSPDHYIGLPATDVTVDSSQTGEGFALELMMWALRRKRIATPREMLDCMLASRHSGYDVCNLRRFARLVDAIEPGLYATLSKVQPTTESMSHGWQAVSQAVGLRID